MDEDHDLLPDMIGLALTILVAPPDRLQQVLLGVSAAQLRALDAECLRRRQLEEIERAMAVG